MKYARLILLFLIANSFFAGANALICGGRLIENCKECGNGNKSYTCAVCEDNYFPLLNNLFCFACDDPLYGQEGCKGQCTYKLDNISLLYVNCSDCKEGYFNYNGICYKCDYYSTGCSECSYDSDTNQFQSLKCSTEEGYRLYINSKYSRCVKCTNLLSNCQKCNLIAQNRTEAQCQQCKDNY